MPGGFVRDINKIYFIKTNVLLVTAFLKVYTEFIVLFFYGFTVRIPIH